MLGASIVAPGSNHLLPLPPEFIRPRDGDEKQGCDLYQYRKISRHSKNFWKH